MGVVDVDDESTWPEQLVKWVDEWAEIRRGTTNYTEDLKIFEDETVLSLLAGHTIRAYHCTRLLDHERETVREQGLRRLDAALVMERIRRAHEVGAITDAERAAFETGHQFALTSPRWKQRVEYTQNQVCLVLSRVILDDAHGVDPLLSTWGGEAIYFPLDKKHGERLRSMGRPSIVVANLDLSVPGDHDIRPQLGSCLVGLRLTLNRGGSDVHYKAPVPPENIEAIWHPGDPDYDRHGELPRV